MLPPLRSRTLLFALAAVSPLSGCMTAAALHQEHERRELAQLRVFDAADHDWALAPAAPITGRLTLTASFRTGYGGVIQRAPEETLSCEGLPVRLIPDSPHMRWLMEWTYRLKTQARGDWRRGQRRDPDEWIWPEPASAAHVRETLCGPGGAFAFATVPPGRYLLLAKIHPTADRAPYEPYDLVLRPVEAAPGRSLDVHIRSDDALAGPLTPD